MTISSLLSFEKHQFELLFYEKIEENQLKTLEPIASS